MASAALSELHLQKLWVEFQFSPELLLWIMTVKLLSNLKAE
jgi:hypothetical protein